MVSVIYHLTLPAIDGFDNEFIIRERVKHIANYKSVC